MWPFWVGPYSTYFVRSIGQTYGAERLKDMSARAKYSDMLDVHIYYVWHVVHYSSPIQA
jgi:hypothetical protein